MSPEGLQALSALEFYHLHQRVLKEALRRRGPIKGSYPTNRDMLRLEVAEHALERLHGHYDAGTAGWWIQEGVRALQSTDDLGKIQPYADDLLRQLEALRAWSLSP